MKITDKIDVLGGIGNESNVYLIDGELLLDTGTGTLFAEMKKYIEKNYDIKKIKRIVNTHCHFDHTGANKKFRDWLKAEILVHEKDRHSVETGAKTLAEMFGQTARTTTVDVSLDERNKIKTANFDFEVVWTPGHTPGSICLYERDCKMLFSGDTLFSEAVGRADLPGGSEADLVNSLKKLMDLPVKYLYPGHGPPKSDGVSFMIKQLFYAMKSI